MRIKDLPIGSLVVDRDSKYYGKLIVWKVLDHNHEGYPSNSVTLLSEKILCLKAFDAKEPNNSISERKDAGNNRYIHSNLRQWLNSSTSNWYSAQHSADAPPIRPNVEYNPYASEKGFMANLTQELRAAILPTSLQALRNYRDGDGLDSFTDKIFILSCTEVGFTNRTSYDEGVKFDYFKDYPDRAAYPTKEAIDNNEGIIHASTNESWVWWLRTSCSHYTDPTEVRVAQNGGFFSNDIASLFCGGVRPAMNVRDDLNVKRGSDGVYEITFNQAPTISGSDTDLGEKNQAFSINYSVKDEDGDTVLIKEYLNNKILRTIENAQNTEQELKISYDLLNEVPINEKATIKIYAEDDKGAGTYRRYFFKRTNTPPTFKEEDTDLGTVTEPPTIKFTPNDDDGNRMIARVKLNQKVVKRYEELTNDKTESYTLDWKEYMQLETDKTHFLWIELEDSAGAVTILKYKFIRKCEKIELVYWTDELDTKVNKIIFNANMNLQMDAQVEQYLCNDYGNGNHWEKVTNNNAHKFTNQVSGKEKIGYKIIIKKSSSGKNYLNNVGGSYI